MLPTQQVLEECMVYVTDFLTKNPLRYEPDAFAMAHPSLIESEQHWFNQSRSYEVLMNSFEEKGLKSKLAGNNLLLVGSGQYLLQKGIDAACHLTVQAFGLSIMGIGTAITPWITALQVGNLYEFVSTLYDLRDTNAYTCTCNSCKDNITYLIDKIEFKALHKGVGVGTLGAWTFARSMNSIIKSFDWEVRPKEMHCRSLISSVTNDKCPRALAAIMVVVTHDDGTPWTFYLDNDDEQEKIRQRKLFVVQSTFAIVMSFNGWELLKKLL